MFQPEVPRAVVAANFPPSPFVWKPHHKGHLQKTARIRARKWKKTSHKWQHPNQRVGDGEAGTRPWVTLQGTVHTADRTGLCVAPQSTLGSLRVKVCVFSGSITAPGT